MSERTDERTVDDGDGDVEVGFDDDELGVDVDALTGGPEPSSDTAGSTPSSDTGGSGGSVLGGLSRLRPSVSVPNPLAKLPSGRSVLLAFVVVLVSMFAAGMIPLIGMFSGFLGVFAGAFALGLVSGKSRYIEFALAGAAVAGLSALQGVFRLAILSDIGLAPFAAFGAGTGLLAAVLGHYFGRDLRDGLTRDV